MFSTTIRRYVDDMEDNKCSVKNSAESPFFMFQLLSKLDSRDNRVWERNAKTKERRKCNNASRVASSRDDENEDETMKMKTGRIGTDGQSSQGDQTTMQ